MAVVQLRHPMPGRDFNDARKAGGAPSLMAMRALKRRLSNVVQKTIDAICMRLSAGIEPDLQCQPPAFRREAVGRVDDRLQRVGVGAPPDDPLATGALVSHPASPQQTLAALYDEAAAAYSEHWAPALHRHAKELVAAVPPLHGGSPVAVDVAAGAGTLAGPLRALVGPQGHVLGLDHSAGMLRRGPANLACAQADAARLPLRDAAADVVVLAFVLFLLPDARVAAVEAARVLRIGGWLLAATWGSQVDTEADVVVLEELDRAGAPSFPRLPRSDELTDTPERMAELLGAAGFVDVCTTARPLDATFDADSALALRTGSGSPGWRFRRLDPTAQQAVHTRAAERLANLPLVAFQDQSEVLLTTARRP